MILEETADGGCEYFLLKAQITVIKADVRVPLEHILAQKAVFIGAQTPYAVNFGRGRSLLVSAIACSGKAAAATVLIQCVIAWVMAFLVRCVGLALGFA